MPFKLINVPKDFECSITHEIMVDPVFTADGDTYEREAIAEWLKLHDTNPNTNEKLEHKSLVPNKKLKSQIAEFVEQNRERFEQELIEAAKQGDNDNIQLVLKLGIDINAQDGNGWSALHHAVYHSHALIVDFLLNKNANVNKNTARLSTVTLPQSNACTILLKKLAEITKEAKMKYQEEESKLRAYQNLIVIKQNIEDAFTELNKGTYYYDKYNPVMTFDSRILRSREQWKESYSKFGFIPASKPYESERELNIIYSRFSVIIQNEQERHRLEIHNIPEIAQIFNRVNEISGIISTLEQGVFNTNTDNMLEKIKFIDKKIMAIKQSDYAKILGCIDELNSYLEKIEAYRQKNLLEKLIAEQNNKLNQLRQKHSVEPPLYGTALHLAAIKNNQEVMQLLIKKGANINILDANDNGWTAEQWAVELGHGEKYQLAKNVLQPQVFQENESKSAVSNEDIV